jgi:uncharacterized protein YndB with AHSA1/START domain
MADNGTKKDLIFKRVFDAPVEQVWNAWTKPDLVKRWWGPDHFECPTAKIDFRVGGTSLVSMVSPELGFPEQYSTWYYTKIVPLKMIEYIHNLADKDGKPIDPVSVGMPVNFPQEMLHMVTFEDLGDNRTQLTVIEKDWPLGQMMEMSKMGMEQCLDKMTDALQ